MPKIHKITYRTSGERGPIVQEISIHYSPKTQLFSAKLPDDIAKHTNGNSEITAKTQDEVERKAMEACDKFYTSAIQQKKVILYYFQRNGTRFSHAKPPRPDQLQRYKPSRYEDNNVTTGKIAFCVKWMVTVGDKPYITDSEIQSATELARATKFQWNDKETFHSTTEWIGWEYLDYTEELEQWLKTSVEAIDSLLDMFDKFFGNDSQTLLNNILTTKYRQLFPFGPQKTLPSET